MRSRAFGIVSCELEDATCHHITCKAAVLFLKKSKHVSDGRSSFLQMSSCLQVIKRVEKPTTTVVFPKCRSGNKGCCCIKHPIHWTVLELPNAAMKAPAQYVHKRDVQQNRLRKWSSVSWKTAKGRFKVQWSGVTLSTGKNQSWKKIQENERWLFRVVDDNTIDSEAKISNNIA